MLLFGVYSKWRVRRWQPRSSEFPGVTQEQYEAVMRDLTQAQGKPAPGNYFHAAGPMEGGWWALDVWESPERLQQYLEEELGAAIQRHDLPLCNPACFPCTTSEIERFALTASCACGWSPW